MENKNFCKLLGGAAKRCHTSKFEKMFVNRHKTSKFVKISLSKLLPIHTYIHTYNIHNTYTHTHTHSYIHIYIHTCIHTHIHKYIYLAEILILGLSLFHSGCHSWQPRWWSYTPFPAAPHTDVFLCLGWHTLSEQMDTLGCWWYSIGQCCDYQVVLSMSVWLLLCYHSPQPVYRSRRGLEGVLVWEQ